MKLTRMPVKILTNKMHTPRAQFDKEQYINRFQPNRFNGKEITGQDLIFVVGHQAFPTNRTAANRGWQETMPEENASYC